MEPFTTELLKYGAGGLIGAIFLFLYLNEKKEHQKTRDSLSSSYQMRIDDSKKSADVANSTAQSAIQALELVGGKIKIGKEA